MPIGYECENSIFTAGGVMAYVLSLVDGIQRHWKYRITYDIFIPYTFKA
jgi:hypothetical protein